MMQRLATRRTSVLTRPFTSGAVPVGASETKTTGANEERKMSKQELRKKLDEEQARIAEEKIRAVEERRLKAQSPIVSTKPRVPNFVKPWQKLWFPNERIVLVRPSELDVMATDLVFRVPPHLTKHEIKDMLEAVYGFDVKKVTTSNRLGKIKYPAGYTMVPGKAYRRPDFKQAYVTLNQPDFKPQMSNQVPRPITAAPLEPSSSSNQS